MPVFLRVLAVVGTAAMIWVGGGIIVHGLETFGVDRPAHLIHDLAEAAAHAAPIAPGLVGWLVGAAGSGLAGLAIGFALIPLVGHVLGPLVRGLARRHAAAPARAPTRRPRASPHEADVNACRRAHRRCMGCACLVHNVCI